jgi:hypothetical protein
MCAERVKREARVCRFCGHAFPKEPLVLTVRADNPANLAPGGWPRLGAPER